MKLFKIIILVAGLSSATKISAAEVWSKEKSICHASHIVSSLLPDSVRNSEKIVSYWMVEGIKKSIIENRPYTCKDNHESAVLGWYNFAIIATKVQSETDLTVFMNSCELKLKDIKCDGYEKFLKNPEHDKIIEMLRKQLNQ